MSRTCRAVVNASHTSARLAICHSFSSSLSSIGPCFTIVACFRDDGTMISHNTPMVPSAPGTSSGAFLRAAQNNTLGVSFSGSGFLIFYFTGVTAVLKHLGLINNTTRLAGTSGGSAAAVLTCADVPVQVQYSRLLDMAAVCRPTGACNGFLDSQVKKSMEAALPQSAAKTCTGRLWASLTAATPGNKSDDNVLLGSTWNSTQQLVSAVRGSSYIPFLSGPSATVKLPDLPSLGAVYDGGFSQAQPCPPGVHGSHSFINSAVGVVALGVTYCIKITPTPWDPKVPSDQGIAAALQFINAQAADSKTAAQDSGTGPYMPLKPNVIPAPKPDIYPGLSKPLPVKAEVWSGYALKVPDAATLKNVYDIGRQDAAFWVVNQGLANAAKATQALQATSMK